MKRYARWILAGLLAFMFPLMNCKLIGVETQYLNVVLTLEHTFRSIYPGNDPNTHTFNPSEYWDDQFDGWEIESAELNDIQVTVWDVTGAEGNVTADFLVKYTNDNQLIITTQTIKLSDAAADIMSVWNNKVTVNAAGKTRVLNDMLAKRIITLSAYAQHVSGNCDFWTKAVIKVQLHLKKT